MSETKFTPAPWAVRDDTVVKIDAKRKDQLIAFIYNGDRFDNCTGIDHQTRRTLAKQEGRANARLICKAPELLEALEYCVEQECNRDPCGWYRKDERCDECWTNGIRQLLARAKGEDERTD